MYSQSGYNPPLMDGHILLGSFILAMEYNFFYNYAFYYYWPERDWPWVSFLQHAIICNEAKYVYMYVRV